MRRSKLATSLLRVRRGSALLGDIPTGVRPADVASAYAIADEVVTALTPKWGAVAGYKIGATSEAGQRVLKLAEPFYGRAFLGGILTSGSSWAVEGKGCTVEAEIGFVMGQSLPARATPYTEPEVRRAVAQAVPLLEINRPAYAKPFEVGGLCLIADNGVTQAFVRAARGRALAQRTFRDEAVTLLQNGRGVATGTAVVVLGDPLRAVVWLANALSRQGCGLRTGDVVASGAMTPPIAFSAGDVMGATYSTLGNVTFNAQKPPR